MNIFTILTPAEQTVAAIAILIVLPISVWVYHIATWRQSPRRSSPPALSDERR